MIGLVAVTALSIGLRFWQLGQFNDLVFDEVYFARFAHDYLLGIPVNDAHPPLGKYLIAAGIWLSVHNPGSAADTLKEVFDQVPVSYRWMNALVGSCIPLLVMAIAHTLSTHNFNKRNQPSAQIFALLSGGFIAIDGLFIVESRYALLNVYIVFFGLLAHWLWLLANSSTKSLRQKTLLRSIAGISLGAAAATKWNGLGYALSLVIWEIWQQRKKVASPHNKLSWIKGTLYLVVVPACTYAIIWWPHLRLTGDAFLSLHQSLFIFHQQLSDVQTACSNWYTWPLLLKPISYWYVDSGETVQAVNNLGNPALWILSFAAILLTGIARLFTRQQKSQTRVLPYLLISYLANWLPWALVNRCTYNYLFMPAAVFGFMTFAGLMSQWLTAQSSWVSRVLAWVMLGAIALSFFFWLPLSLGLPLTPDQLQLRWWLPSWI